MAKVKGMKKLNKKMTKLIRKETGLAIRKVELADLFEYNFVKDRIRFKITNALEDEIFTSFIKARYEIDLSDDTAFLLSILHEIGHRENNEDVDGAVYDFCIKEKEFIENKMQTADNLDDVINLEMRYFTLPDEILATDWAVAYLLENKVKCAKMYKKIQKYLQKFYKINGIGAE